MALKLMQICVLGKEGIKLVLSKRHLHLSMILGEQEFACTQKTLHASGHRIELM
jgi:hypothetical protein